MKIAIIGAGLTGLVSGYRLSQNSHKVTIFEKGNDIGGLTGGFEIYKTSLEKAYHHIFKTDNYIIDLIKELVLQSRLKWYPESTAVYYDRQMYPFMGAMDLLNFKPLDLISKIRLGLVKIWLEKDNDWKKYSSVTADEWMKKWCGQKAYEVIWEPLLRGKFHQYYDKVSMAWLWARIHTRANSEELGYLEGGFQQIADELAKRIKDNGGEIILNSEVKETDLAKKYNKIISTIPEKKVDYLGFVNVVFTSDQNLSKYYWHNINDKESPFLAFIQHTNLVDKNNYENTNVYYLGTYVPQDHRFLKMSEKEIYQEFFEYLKKIVPKFEEKEIIQKFVFKFRNAQQVVTTNYVVPPTKISEELYRVNFAQIYPEDRGINYAVRDGAKVAFLILRDLGGEF
jgi:protoporphyrinogen oxidase